MENEKIDFPIPPHYYLSFETPESLSPPDIRRIASNNQEFYPLGGREPFADEGEKIFPYYLAEKRVLYNDQNMKQSLIDLIEGLHKLAQKYIQSIATETESLPLVKDEMDNVLHNIFYVLKRVRAIYEARSNLTAIYKVEAENREKESQMKVKKLESLLRIIDSVNNN